MESWKRIPEFGGLFEASSLGRIRSIDKYVEKYSALTKKIERQFYKGKVLSRIPDKDGYFVVRFGYMKKKYTMRVNRLVLMAFKGSPTKGQQSRHLNGVRDDNRPENLAWGSAIDNAKDRKRHRNYATGESHPMAKITADDAKKLKQWSGTVKEACNYFGIGRTQYYRIKNGESWADQE